MNIIKYICNDKIKQILKWNSVICKHTTVKNESLKWLKFGKSGPQIFWWKKVCQFDHKVNKMSCGLVVIGEWKFGKFYQFAKFAKL